MPKMGAWFEGQYRYHAWRVLNREAQLPNRVLFVLYRPQGDPTTDPTLNACWALARRWDFDSAEVCCLYARCAPSAEMLHACADPVGPKNEAALFRALRRADAVVVAWGSTGHETALAQRLLHNIPDGVRLYRVYSETEGVPGDVEAVGTKARLKSMLPPAPAEPADVHQSAALSL